MLKFYNFILNFCSKKEIIIQNNKFETKNLIYLISLEIIKT